VPDVVGQSLAGARRRLRQARLTVGTVLRHSGGTTLDVVESQDPVSGTVVHVGSAVALVQKSVIVVPDLRGTGLEEARVLLRQRLLATGKVQSRWVLGPWQEAIRSQSPSPGAVVAVNSLVDVEMDDPLPTRAVVFLAGVGGAAELVRRMRARSKRPPPGVEPHWQPRWEAAEPDVAWGGPPGLPAIEILLVPDGGTQSMQSDRPDVGGTSPWH